MSSTAFSLLFEMSTTVLESFSENIRWSFSILKPKIGSKHKNE